MEAGFLQQTREALKGQYHAGLQMMRQAIEACPDDLWEGGEHPNQFWHVAYHGLFYTHLYLQPDEAAFVAWEHHRDQYQFLGTVPWPPFDPPNIGVDWIGTAAAV